MIITNDVIQYLTGGPGGPTGPSGPGGPGGPGKGEGAVCYYICTNKSLSYANIRNSPVSIK